jgi:hypothetical protein
MSRPLSGSVLISRDTDYEAYLRGPDGASDSSSGASSAASSDEDDHHSSEDGSYDEDGRHVTSPTGRSKKSKKETRDEGEGSVGSSGSGTNNTSSLGGNASQQQRPKDSFVNYLFHSLFSPNEERRSGRSDDEGGSSGLDGEGEKDLGDDERPLYWCTTRRIKVFIVLLLAGAGIGVSVGAHQVVKNSESTDFNESVSPAWFVTSCATIGPFLIIVSSQYFRLATILEKETAFMIENFHWSLKTHSKYITGEVVIASRENDDVELLPEWDAKSNGTLDSVEISVDSTTASSSNHEKPIWPNVTLLTFEIVGYRTILKGGMDHVFYLPILNTTDELAEWNAYSSSASNPAAAWIDISREIYSQSGTTASHDFLVPSDEGYVSPQVVPFVYHPLESAGLSNSSRALGVAFPTPIDPTKTPPPYLPSWQVSPPPNVNQTKFINMDLYQLPFVAPLVDAITNPSSGERGGVFSPFTSPPTLEGGDLSYMWNTRVDAIPKSAAESTKSTVILTFDRMGDVEYSTTSITNTESPTSADEKYYALPRSIFAEPVLDNVFGDKSVVKGVILASINWDVFLAHLMFRSAYKQRIGNPEAPLIDIVLQNSCNESYTFRVLGPEVRFISGSCCYVPFGLTLNSTFLLCAVVLCSSWRQTQSRL